MSEKLEALMARQSQAVMQSYGRYPIGISRGQGTKLFDLDGREYLDLLAGIAVVNLGHCHPEITRAVCDQMARLVHVSNLFYQAEQVDLAEALLATWRPGRVFFCNSGAEANEGAIKLARRYQHAVRGQDRHELITLKDSFHGRTLATLTATGQDKIKDGFAPLPAGFVCVPPGDLEAMRAAIGPKTAAVLLEVVQGEGGVRPLDEGYLKAVQALCREQGVLFMVDEVQTGLCRTGRFWAHQHFGLEPDVITVAKGLANGLPMGAVMATAEVAQAFGPGSHATTFGGGPVLSVAARKVVEILLRDRLADRARLLGEHTLASFEALRCKHPDKIKDVRGLGLLLGVELTGNGKAVWEKLLDRGFILNLSHDTVLRLVPPLTITREELDGFVRALDQVLAGA